MKIFILAFILLLCHSLVWSDTDENSNEDSGDNSLFGITFASLSPGLPGLTYGSWEGKDGDKSDIYVLGLYGDNANNFANSDNKGVLLRSLYMRRHYPQDEDNFRFPFPYVLAGPFAAIWKEPQYWGGLIGLTGGAGGSWMGLSLEFAYSVYMSRRAGSWQGFEATPYFVFSLAF